MGALFAWMLGRLMDREATALKDQREVYADQMRFLHGQVREEIERSDKRVAENDDRWRAVLEIERAATLKVVEQQQLGGPRREIEIASRMEDVHEKLEQRVGEDTIRRGMEELRRGYTAVGIAIDDDELREEVMMLSSGHRPVLPGERIGG